MYSKLFCIVLLCVSSSFASDEPKIYEKSIFVQNKEALREHPELYRTAGAVQQRGKSTYNKFHTWISLSPDVGAIDEELYFHSSRKCTYTIEAPSEGQRIIVLHVVNHIASTEDFQNVPESSLYDPNLRYDIYDGTEKTESNRLYKLGDQYLNNAVSRGRYLTIDLNFEKSGKYIGQSIGTRFGLL
ncbi:hypothetical protein TSAR_007362 [Trichomalopsis sarcophagae]|uniref:CUB domain-containing protein n=1 Tax=Trichomalopsis sarcophagae TaxID=543379 RepID=A0A232FKX3_9HYME|nr:hypothetical protein TSAR_007362 [Trichomalopsis sarcophagae]